MQLCNRFIALMLIVTTATGTLHAAPFDQHLHELYELEHIVVSTPVEHLHADELRALVKTHHRIAKEIRNSFDLTVGERLHLLKNLKHNLLHLVTSASDEIRTQFNIHEEVDPEDYFLAPIHEAIREVEGEQTAWEKHKTKIIIGSAAGVGLIALVIGLLVREARASNDHSPMPTIAYNPALAQEKNLREAALWGLFDGVKDNDLYTCAEPDDQIPALGADRSQLSKEFYDLRLCGVVSETRSTSVQTERNQLAALINLCTSIKLDERPRFYKYLTLIALDKQENRMGDGSILPAVSRAIHKHFGDEGMKLASKLLKPLGVQENELNEAYIAPQNSAQQNAISGDNEFLRARAHLLAHAKALKECGLMTTTEFGTYIVGVIYKDNAGKDLQSNQHARIEDWANKYQTKSKEVYNDSELRTLAEYATLVAHIRDFVIKNDKTGPLDEVELKAHFQPDIADAAVVRIFSELFSKYIVKKTGLETKLGQPTAEHQQKVNRLKNIVARIKQAGLPDVQAKALLPEYLQSREYRAGSYDEIELDDQDSGERSTEGDDYELDTSSAQS